MRAILVSNMEVNKLIAAIDDTEEGPYNPNGSRCQPIPLALQKAKSFDQNIPPNKQRSIREKYKTPVENNLKRGLKEIKAVIPPLSSNKSFSTSNYLHRRAYQKPYAPTRMKYQHRNFENKKKKVNPSKQTKQVKH